MSKSPRPARVLIIEDSDDVLFILKTELEFLGYVVEVAPDAVQGLQAAKTLLPDVIVSDIGLPGLDGFELLKRVRETAELAAVPVIALTGYESKHDWDLVRTHEFNAYMVKPVDGDSLSDVIQSALHDGCRRGL